MVSVSLGLVNLADLSCAIASMRRLMQRGGGGGVRSILAGVVLLVAQAAARHYMGGASMHKNLFPLSGQDITGLTLAAGSLFVAAGGGIGCSREPSSMPNALHVSCLHATAMRLCKAPDITRTAWTQLVWHAAVGKLP